VEVADFEGALPHSHTKVMIVDGKTILTAGFNMEYKHYAVDHPSGLGEGKQDLGLLVSGPVVQNSHRMFDDLWEGSDLYTCSDFYPANIDWRATCMKETAVADHVPEVLKYYLPGADSAFFSMYRSKEHDEADRIVERSLGAAQNHVDAMHVMFAMEMVCDLNLLFELCDFGEATEYLDGLMQAAENGATIRLILNPLPLNGIEAAVAYDVFIHELENRGLRDQVEIRFFDEGPVHYKTTLIDDEFLVVGSQNFHYSAYGQGTGLSEYSLGTNDLKAIEDYRQLFDYQWEQAVQR
jgi:cardiolipin synthase